MRKTIAFSTVFVMSVLLFAQSDMAKYGDKGAPEVRIPQTWYSNTSSGGFTQHLISSANGAESVHAVEVRSLHAIV